MKILTINLFISPHLLHGADTREEGFQLCPNYVRRKAANINCGLVCASRRHTLLYVKEFKFSEISNTLFLESDFFIDGFIEFHYGTVGNGVQATHAEP